MVDVICAIARIKEALERSFDDTYLLWEIRVQLLERVGDLLNDRMLPIDTLRNIDRFDILRCLAIAIDVLDQAFDFIDLPWDQRTALAEQFRYHLEFGFVVEIDCRSNE
jgi:hypothetical protein